MLGSDTIPRFSNGPLPHVMQEICEYQKHLYVCWNNSKSLGKNIKNIILQY